MTGIATPLAESVTVTWFKSSYSGGEGNECVEVAHTFRGVGVRDSKNSDQHGFTVSTVAFTQFIDGLKDSVTYPMP